MDFKDSLLNYFNETKIPADLEPDKVFSFVKPRAVEKKTVEAVQPTKPPAPEPKKEPPRPAPEPVKEIPPAVSEPEKAAPKPAPAPLQKAEEKPAQNAEPAHESGASAFIKVIFYHKLTRNEFLTLLGDTKIGAETFREIKSNPGLTVKGLIDILEDSPLTGEDYKKLIIAAERTAKLKEETKEKLRSEEPNRAESKPAPPPNPIIPPASSKPKLNLTELTSPKTQEMPPIKEHEPDLNRTNEFSLKGEPKMGVAFNTAAPSPKSPLSDDQQDDNVDDQKDEKPKRKLLFGRRKNREADEDIDGEDTDLHEDNMEDLDEEDKKKKKKKGGRRKKDIEEEDDTEPFDGIPDKKADNNTDDDTDDDYDDFDEDYDEHRSNAGKFAAAAIGAVLLIGLSFGLRYYFTGSIMPDVSGKDPITDNSVADVSEEVIFDLISSKPAAELSGYDPTPAYTVGGVREESCLKQIVITDKRLVYIMGNSLYIFEQIGGQTAQLDVRNYPSDITLVGLAETGKGIAVISETEGEPYSFVRTENTAEGAEEGSAPQTVTDTVARPETVIELLDKDNPEKRAGIAKYRLSGLMSDIFTYSDRLIVLTEENIPQNATKEDFVTFMPFVLTNEGRKLCGVENASVSKTSANSIITAAFALTFDKETDNDTAIACTAGDPVKAVTLCNGYLYLGTGNRLLKIAADGDLSEKGRYTVSGTFEDFSAIGVDNTGGAQLVRVTFKGEQGTDLAILNTDMELVGEVKGLGSGEAAAATCFYKNETYIVTETGTCFGVDGGNQVITESAVKITGSNIYLLSFEGNAQTGIKVTPADENGKRTALTVSTVKLNGTEEVLNSTSISSKTVAKNALDEYLSSPAENSGFAIGSRITENGAGVVVVPAVYFDGVSEVELFVIYNISAEGNLSVNGTVAYYDGYSKNIYSIVKGEYVIAVTDKRIITAKAENGSVTSYYEVAESEDVYNY